MQQSALKHSDSKQESLFLMNLSVNLVDLGLAHLGGSASRCASSWTSVGTLLQMHSLWVQNESWQLLRGNSSHGFGRSVRREVEILKVS